MNNLLYLGIDVSKQTLDCCLEVDAKKAASSSVSNDVKGLEQIQELLGEQVVNTRVVLEATSCYHRLAARTLSQAGAKVLVLNPARARALALGLGVIDKDDKLDAQVLAKAGRILNDKETQLVSKLHEELRDLSRAIDTQTKNNADNKKRLCSLEKDSSAYKFLKDMIKVTAAQIRTGKSTWLKLVKQEAEIYRRYQQALSVPDVGKETARVVSCELSGNLERFTTAQICAYAGIVPRRNQSGASKGTERTGKMGNAHLRTGIFMASSHSVFSSKRNAGFYKELIGKGHLHMQAMVAVLHRLLREIVAVIKRDTIWQKDPPNLKRTAPITTGATT
jgi:transposase